ncbi:MAG TPA: hypothetical protein VFE47_00385 [Tepidisphaeraceae bacterium]|jgi:hypothetical protein|nr:hypothetical protein [Tepidisphaeraceae bacterium]
MQLIVIPLLAFGFLLSDFNNADTQPALLTHATVRHSTPTGRNARIWTQTHVAVKGDTVSKLAAHFLGANTKANRDAIIALNPSLQQNPNLLIVGKTYRLPIRKL